MSDKITRETEVSTGELALVLGVTARYVRQLAEDGILVKSSRGRFNLTQSVQAYIESKGSDEPDEEEQRSDREINRSRMSAEAKLKNAKAEIAELDAQERKGKMHRSEDVAAMTTDLIYAIRGALLALPGRLAVDVIGVNTAAEASEIIRREVYHVMEELAAYEYDPAKYEERVRERLRLEAMDNADDE